MKVHAQKLVNGFPILKDSFITKEYKTVYNLFKYSEISSMEGDFCLSYLDENRYSAYKKVEYYIPELEHSHYMFVKILFVGDNKFSIETVIRKNSFHQVIVQKVLITVDPEKLENWSNFLRTTKRQQGVGKLYRKMEDGGEYFCSLGILGISCDEALFSTYKNTTTLSGNLLKKSLGLETTTASREFQSIFIYLNDIFGFTFRQIADVIDLFVEAFKTRDYQKISVFRFRENEIIQY